MLENRGTDETLEQCVRSAYAAIAEQPNAEHPFPVGRQLALDLGYPATLLDSLPERAIEAFSGVAPVSLLAGIEPDCSVLDLGCGAGTDTFVALSHGANVTAVDFSASMLSRVRKSAGGFDYPGRLKILEAEAHKLPLADGVFELVMVNGLFNLNPKRKKIQREIVRVLRSGGRAVIGELIRRPGMETTEPDHDNWVA